MKQMEISWLRLMSWPMTVLQGKVHLLLISKLPKCIFFDVIGTNVDVIVYSLGRNMP